MVDELFIMLNTGTTVAECAAWLSEDAGVHIVCLARAVLCPVNELSVPVGCHRPVAMIYSRNRK